MRAARAVRTGPLHKSKQQQVVVPRWNLFLVRLEICMLHFAAPAKEGGGGGEASLPALSVPRKMHNAFSQEKPLRRRRRRKRREKGAPSSLICLWEYVNWKAPSSLPFFRHRDEPELRRREIGEKKERGCPKALALMCTRKEIGGGIDGS